MLNSQLLAVLFGGVAIGAGVGAGGALLAKSRLNSEKAASVSTHASPGTCSISGMAATSPTNAPLFELDGQQVTRESLPADVQDAIYQLESQAYEQLNNYLKEVALRLSIAKKDKLDLTKELPALQKLLGAQKISEQELRKFFDQNKAQLPPGATYEQLKGQIEQFLQNQQLAKLVRKRVDELEASGKFKSLLTPAVAPIVELDLALYPSQGPADAKVTVVEVSDYFCPHCRAMKGEVEKVIREFENKVRFVQVNFPLQSAGLSGYLARGAYCAQKLSSSAFWKFHEKAFQVPFEAQRPVSPNADKEFSAHASTIAKEIGLDLTSFETCLAAPETRKAVDDAVEKMTAVGVGGTPTIFVNNQKIQLGAQPLRAAIRSKLEI